MSREQIEAFVARKELALVGVSRSPVKFGRMAFRELRARGYNVYPVNPAVEELDGVPVYPTLAELPIRPEAVLMVTKPDVAASVLREGADLGVSTVWFQQGAEFEEAIRCCQEHGIDFVAHECILMHAPPVRSFHRLHRWLWRLLGKLDAGNP